ncbi:hypothetical protein V6Z05_18225 [Leptospira venezuelensis]|uniref:hypothetical protein n=1 Tax=Leptospira venezuelensis TaxID=1958811 RepID=UPI000A376534|nr:hypothetical protein [Leptospira venezuelensis]
MNLPIQRIIILIFLIISVPNSTQAKRPTSVTHVNNSDLSGLYFRIDKNEYGDSTMYLILTKRSDSKYNIYFNFADYAVEQGDVSLICAKGSNCRMVLSSGKILMNFNIVSKDIVVKISSKDKSEVRDIIDNGARFSQDMENKPFQYRPLE